MSSSGVLSVRALKHAPLASSGAADERLLCAFSTLISLLALLGFLLHGSLLLYGDAVAHINIARHLFDSRTPGLFELGTVWLPLPHLLQAPFIVNNWLWRTGLGASLPSMAAYALGTLAIFRLLRGFASRAAAWAGALAYALNPNLMYMQATAMTEVLYLALFLWAVLFFCKAAASGISDAESSRRSIERCALAISAAMLVRYDGWFLAGCVWFALLILLWRFKFHRIIFKAALRLVLLTGLTGCLWLAYNHGAYNNALEFANGPYSARAIAARSRSAGMPSDPGEKNPAVAALYFLKAARMNLGEGRADLLLLAATCLALPTAILISRRHLPLALLWTPLLFYAVSIAWGHVPVYLPAWWPFSYYNVRYGLQLLPAVAVFLGLSCEILSRWVRPRIALPLVAVLIALSYGGVWQKKPICLREAEANGTDRLLFDHSLAAQLRKLPDSATVMMYCGSHSGAIQDAGIPFRRVLREGNHPAWDIALTEPAKAADSIVAIEGDPIALAVRLFPEGLRVSTVIAKPGAPRAVIYSSAIRAH